MSELLLQVQDLSVRYHATEVLHGVGFNVRRGEIVTLIGANGAGKTTTLKAISGLLKPSTGRVLYRGRAITGLAPHQIARQRLAHVPEGRGIFLNLTVEENLDLGAWAAPDPRSLARDLDQAYELFPRLKERRNQSAGTLSGGEQQMLAIARALMLHPELLLLDEPSLGLAPQIIERIFEIIQRIARPPGGEAGTTVLLVEQNARLALSIADQGLVLEAGRLVQTGPSKELLGSDAVRKAYLGG